MKKDIFEDTLEQNLSVVIEELKIIKERYKKDFDLVIRADNSIRLLEKWY